MTQEKEETIARRQVHPDANGWRQNHADANGWKPGEEPKKEDDGKWVSRHPDAHGWTHSSHS